MTLNERSAGRRLSPRRIPTRQLVTALGAILAGVAIGYVDSRPGWDSDVITIASLVAAGFGAAFVSGRRPWLWAILVGVWVPVFEISRFGPVSLVGLVLAAVGAGAGWMVARGAHAG